MFCQFFISLSSTDKKRSFKCIRLQFFKELKSSFEQLNFMQTKFSFYVNDCNLRTFYPICKFLFSFSFTGIWLHSCVIWCQPGILAIKQNVFCDQDFLSLNKWPKMNKFIAVFLDYRYLLWTCLLAWTFSHAN